MEIKSTLTNRAGQVLDVVYNDIESERDFADKPIAAVHAYCFCDGKLVVVYAANKGYWAPPGGGVEPGEDARTAVRREVLEETNMRVVRQRFIGVQDIYEPGRVVTQTRSVCIVERVGEFVADPDGDVTEIKLIDPSEYKKYFDWGIVGDRLMQRALDAYAQMKAEADYVQ